jgi:hypothetical protein
MSEPPRKKRPTIILEFSDAGTFLTAIYFAAESDHIYDALLQSFYRLTKQDHRGWITRLFGRREP